MLPGELGCFWRSLHPSVTHTETPPRLSLPSGRWHCPPQTQSPLWRRAGRSEDEITRRFTSCILKQVSLSPGCRLELLQVLMSEAVMPRQVYQGPDAALVTGGSSCNSRSIDFRFMHRPHLVIFGFVWRTAVCDGGLRPLELSWQQLLKHDTDNLLTGHHQTPASHQLSVLWQATWRRLQWFQLTRLNRRVFPESHSPTSSTALRTVLLVRKYFRNTAMKRQTTTPTWSLTCQQHRSCVLTWSLNDSCCWRSL